MGVLVPIPTYLQPDDYTVSANSDLAAVIAADPTGNALVDLLVRASARVNAIMRRSLLAEERLITFFGNGSSTMNLKRTPLLYVKRMQFVVPGAEAYVIPLDRVRVDSEKGTIAVYAPLALQGVGRIAFFPEGVPFDVTFAWGYGWSGLQSPAFALVDIYGPTGSLPPGPYSVGVSTVTQWGETVPIFLNYTTATGAFQVGVSPALGAYFYRVYVAAGLNASANAMFVLELPATTFGDGGAYAAISSLNPPPFEFATPAPTVDSSAPMMPSELRQAVLFLALDEIRTNKNIALRGIADDSGLKFASVSVTKDGSSYYVAEATRLLKPLSLQQVF